MTFSIIDACRDPKVFGPAFRDKDTWQAWFAFLAALFGLPMDDEQHRLFAECTQRTDRPSTPFLEAWLVCGRRAGKSFVLALVAVFLACSRDWLPYLGIGERGTVMVIAADRRQARTILRYVKGLLQLVPMLTRMIEAERQEAVDLSNRISIEVHTASFKTTRGYTIVAALLDEIAFWPTDPDSADPDGEVVSAIKPAMATVPGAMLLCASSPYARRGALWEAYHRYYGQSDGPLIWQASTRTMNPTVPQGFIDAEYEKDAVSAEAEFGAQFRTDIESFVSREAVDAVVDRSVLERPPVSGKNYVGFTDPSGGSGDSYTVAVAHAENGIGILDCHREVRPPFSPEAVTAEFADLLKSYRVTKVSGDRYAGEWPREQFRKHGIEYEPSADPKGAIYGNLLPLLNSGKVRLLNNKRLITQLIGLERRTSRGGRDSIDHAPGGHDDCANAVAGALLLAVSRRGFFLINGRRPLPDGKPDWSPAGGPSYVEPLRIRVESVSERDLPRVLRATVPAAPFFRPVSNKRARRR